MDILWAVLGVLLLILISIDILWTTLLIAGGGPITNLIVSFVWSKFLFLHRKTKNHKLLSYGGLVVIIVNLVVWVGLTYLSWVLIFSSQEQAILQGETKAPADLGSRIYYVGYTLITLGVGDYVAGSDLWQIVTIIASANGFIFVTLSITYLLPIVSSVVQKRSLGGYIFSLGETPCKILSNAWNGKDYSELSSHFPSLSSQILELSQKHLAYPILHCFHTPNRHTATAPNIAALDEALTILEYGIPTSQQPPSLAINTLRNSISIFFGNRHSPSLKDDADTPPSPDLGVFEDKSISTDQFEIKLQALKKRRKILLSFVLHDGWEWGEVINPPQNPNKDLLVDPTLLNKAVSS